NRIRAECASDEGKPTRLALTVNGRQLAELADSRRLGPFDWAWLVASSSKKPLPSVTRFDDVVVSAR
ncbi:MAG TPA: hypothetical protein VNJ53_07600, partial [Gaiellaceae bacterium]|nr:hypothetical protein [Gaiellaceae bacterium]